MLADAARGASAGIHGAMADDAGPSVEGSSVVLVSTADALQDDEALDPARAGCFALVAAKVSPFLVFCQWPLMSSS